MRHQIRGRRMCRVVILRVGFFRVGLFLFLFLFLFFYFYLVFLFPFSHDFPILRSTSVAADGRQKDEMIASSSEQSHDNNFLFLFLFFYFYLIFDIRFRAGPSFLLKDRDKKRIEL